MKFVYPKVYLVASTSLNMFGIREYLDSIDSLEWLDRVKRDDIPDSDILPEFAGRVCYRSFKPGLNPNVEKVRTDSQAYLHNILSSRHGSVLEHVNFTFMIQHISRVFTHELITHRAGCAKSQESLRYVRLDNLDFVDPRIIFDGELSEEDCDLVRAYVKTCENFQRSLIGRFIKDGMKFNRKKKLTSWFRRFAPIGLATSILWTTNLRSLRHTIPTRTSIYAEAEIRMVFDLIARLVSGISPLCFQDMSRNPNGEWKVEFEKV